MNGLVAADIGNSSIKLGWFAASTEPFPIPVNQATFSVDQIGSHAWTDWIQSTESRLLPWAIASVNQPACKQLHNWLENEQVQYIQLTHDSIDLQTALPVPGQAGIDRLLAAAAANQLRTPESAAVIVDSGTAITVDLIDSDGTFKGGAILPGLQLSAKSLAQHTDQLPLLDIPESESNCPPATGSETASAITSGVFWGSLGAVRELIARQIETLDSQPVEVFVSGGNLPWADLIGDHIIQQPSLVLTGIAITASGKLLS